VSEVATQGAPAKVQKPAKAMISSGRISRRVGELGSRISDVYRDIDTPLVMVVILKGATVFAADLLRSLSIPAELEFVRAASYGSGTSSTGHVQIAHMVDGPLIGRHVLLVEDIVDSGRTVASIFSRFRRLKPASLRLAALLDRRAPEAQKNKRHGALRRRRASKLQARRAQAESGRLGGVQRPA